MEKIYLFESPESLIPQQHEGDAGFDLVAKSRPHIEGVQYDDGSYGRIDYIEYDTELKIAPENYADTFSLLFPRSSISQKNLLLANSVGVIDGGYRGSIKVRFKYVVQPDDLRSYVLGRILVQPDFKRIYAQGDKIAQIVFFKKLATEFTCKSDYELKTSREDGGFGSTGK